MYRVWCKFEPEYINPLTGRVGRWRVSLCAEILNMTGKRSEVNGYTLAKVLLPDVMVYDSAFKEGFVGYGCSALPATKRELIITSTKPYKRGSIIRPHKELNRVLAARRAARLAEIDKMMALTDSELPGLWERADFAGGIDEVRGPDWKPPQDLECLP